MSAQRGMFTATVVANQPLCREHFRLVMSLPSFPATAPGQFVQLGCGPQGGDDWLAREVEWDEGQFLRLGQAELAKPMALLRRPFSLAGRRDACGRVELDVIHRVVGVGTEWLSHLVPGQPVQVLGPLGNRFELPTAGRRALLVGGGVGIPPMLYLASCLAGIEAIAFCGALEKSLLPFRLNADQAGSADDVTPRRSIEDFAAYGVDSVASTDDGSFGFRGYVTQALEAYLSRHHVRGPEAAIVYTCGPEPMMKRVAEIAQQFGLPCQVAVERAMACGMGTCQSCVIRVRDPEANGGRRYRLACTDGPIFAAERLLW